jgi:large subunit ribosomal protein L4
MPTGMRRAALREALAAKIAAGGVAVVEQVGLTEPRTKLLTTWIREVGIEPGSTLLVVAERSATLERAARNVPWLQVETPQHASAYQILRYDRLVFERAALLSIEEALKA